VLEKLPDSLGHALRHQRAGLDKTLFQRLPLRTGQGAIEVRSLAFVDHAPIPSRYTADGAGCSPPLQWSGVPAAARSLVLIVEDADAPMPMPLVHAIAVNLPAGDRALPEAALDRSGDDMHAMLALGRNSALGTGWMPPDPPPGHGPHRYAFQVFALADGPAFEGHPGRDAVADALAARAIASGCLVGTYERHDTTLKTTEPAAAAVGPSERLA
jgi:Raf kinase inhibitor-like YbhB/YbcL family protein